MNNPTDLVQVTMTREEVARRWAYDNNFMLIPFSVVEDLVVTFNTVYPDQLVYDAKNLTYILRDKAA